MIYTCDQCFNILEEYSFDTYYEYERNICNRCKAENEDESLDLDEDVYEDYFEDDFDFEDLEDDEDDNDDYGD